MVGKDLSAAQVTRLGTRGKVVGNGLLTANLLLSLLANLLLSDFHIATSQ